MNIFYLDPNPRKCAQYHFDKHINKLITESAQMMSTALWCSDPLIAEDYLKTGSCYMPTHINHPSNIWVRQSLTNYIWLRNLIIYLNEERKYRWDKQNDHKSYLIAMILPFPNLPIDEFTQPPQAMPERLHQEDSVLAYRLYYMAEEKIIWLNGLKEDIQNGGPN